MRQRWGQRMLRVGNSADVCYVGFFGGEVGVDLQCIICIDMTGTSSLMQCTHSSMNMVEF